VLLPAIAGGLLAGGSVSAEEAPSWTDSITVNGDLRLRYEMIRQEQADDRNRARFRGRLGVSADLAPDIRLGFELASGGDDPVSTNQTFGDGFTTKDIGVNLAYVRWTFHDNWSLTGGKMKLPWFRPGGTSLVWDGDLNPEGVFVAYKDKMFFGSVGTFLVAERSAASETMLNTFQGGVELPLSDDSSIVFAAGYFDYTNVIGQSPFYDDDAQGNTVDANGNYVFDYNEVELTAQYKTRLGKWPVTVFGDYVVNTEVDREDSAYSFGISFGQAKKPGEAQFSYAWHDTAADALNATFNESDLANGLTDSRGHFLRAGYAIRDDIQLNGTLILSEFGGFTGNARDFDRLMLDVQFSF